MKSRQLVAEGSSASTTCGTKHFNHAKRESMAKMVKLQEKISEVMFNKLWPRWPCV